MNIGTFTIDEYIALGPMAGVTDLAFRLICKSFGCPVVYTEMVSAKALYYNDPKTERLMHIEEEERPVALQIFGSDAAIMGQITKRINDHNHDILDINMGCPAPKIVKNGDGSALMRDPHRVGAIVKAVKEASSKPVTVKIRKGWDDLSVNAVQIAQIAEANGADAVTVHGRTREQFYSGVADWDIIKEVKKAVQIPVIGNGDIFGIEDAVRMKDHTGCDGIMVARGAQGKPWIFKQLTTYFKTGEKLPEPDLEERIKIIRKHMEMVVAIKGERIGILEMRKHAAWYLKGIYGASKARQKINTATDFESMMSAIEGLL